MRRLLALLLALFGLVALAYLIVVMLYTGLGRVTDTGIKAREAEVERLEQKKAEAQQLAKDWSGAEEEYRHFRDKVLIKRDRFAEFRKTLGEKISANQLRHGNLGYQNKTSQDGQLSFVQFNFDVEGGYGQIKRLIWDLEHMPHAALLRSVSMRIKENRQLSCSIALEVIFEK